MAICNITLIWPSRPDSRNDPTPLYLKETIVKKCFGSSEHPCLHVPGHPDMFYNIKNTEKILYYLVFNSTAWKLSIR